MQLDQQQASPSRPDGKSMGKWAVKSAGLCMDWLSASVHIKDIRKAPEAATDFARIFSRGSSLSKEQLLSGMETMSYATLREARVRCDIASMMLWRKLVQHVMDTHDPSSVHCYLYIDSSPQWRGFELLATSLEIFDGSSYTRRLLLVVSLDRNRLGIQGKAIALLWQLWLVCGPSFSALKFVTERVQAICSDMGTESGIANMVDILPAFFRMIAPGMQTSSPHERLFGRALQVPGWRHLWDNILRRTLASLPWFASWLDSFKAVVGFLRSVSVVSELSKMFIDGGVPAMAEVLRKLRLPHFAAWRWGTLRDCCKGVEPILEPLARHLDANVFRGSRDPTIIAKVEAALASRAWRQHFGVVFWICTWLGRITDWCGGCSCHDAQDPDAMDCSERGRRWLEAHSFALQALRSGLDIANGWTGESWGLGLEFVLALQACVRGAFALAREKIGFLNKLPYLLFRLREVGIARRCVEEFDRTPIEAHHRVSVAFLRLGSPLRAAMEQIRPDGSGISSLLQTALQGLAGKWSPLFAHESLVRGDSFECGRLPEVLVTRGFLHRVVPKRRASAKHEATRCCRHVCGSIHQLASASVRFDVLCWCCVCDPLHRAGQLLVYLSMKKCCG